MHKTSGLRDPAASFPLPGTRDDTADRRQANRAIAVSALGLAATGLIELLLAILTGSVGLLGDAIHNLSDVSTSAVVFLGFRLSAGPTERYPYGLERAEDLAGVGIAVVIWASAAFAGYESIRKLVDHGHTSHLAAGIAGAVIGILGNQIVARYKLVVGRRINSATLIADARHSWLDALSSAGALAGLIAVALGQPWGDPVAGLAVTAFICHVGYEVTGDVVHRLADGIDPAVITGAEAAAGSVPGVLYAHARARWTGRTLRVEIEGWVDPDLPVRARTASAAGRRRPGPGSPRSGQPHLDHPRWPGLTAITEGHRPGPHRLEGAAAREIGGSGALPHPLRGPGGPRSHSPARPASHRTAPEASRMTRTEVCWRSKPFRTTSSSVTQPVAGTPPGTAPRASSIRSRAWSAWLVAARQRPGAAPDVRDDTPFVEALSWARAGACEVMAEILTADYVVLLPRNSHTRDETVSSPSHAVSYAWLARM